jgi:microtubule-associated protein tau
MLTIGIEIPMNKVKVGAAPSPNLKEVKSKVGSLASATIHKPSGGQVKIESNKLAWKAESRVGSLSNVKYSPGGGKFKVGLFMRDGVGNMK